MLLHPAPHLISQLSQSLSLGPRLFPYPNGGRAMMVTSLCETNKKYYMQTCIWYECKFKAVLKKKPLYYFQMLQGRISNQELLKG